MARQGLNKAILIGNLGADPELTYTQGGQPRLKMRLATSESFTTRSGERKEKTEWHTIVLWGKRAEALGKFLTKGRSLCVEGSIEYYNYEDRDGNKRYATQINARNVVLLGGGREGGGGGDYNRGGGGGGDYGRGGGGGGDNFGGGGGGYDDFPADDFGDDDMPF